MLPTRETESEASRPNRLIGYLSSSMNFFNWYNPIYSKEPAPKLKPPVTLPPVETKNPISKDELVADYLALYTKNKNGSILTFLIFNFASFSALNKDRILCFLFKNFNVFLAGQKEAVLTFLQANSILVDYFFMNHFYEFSTDDKKKILNNIFNKMEENKYTQKTKTQILAFLGNHTNELSSTQRDKFLEILFNDLDPASKKELPLKILNAAEDLYKEYDVAMKKAELAFQEYETETDKNIAEDKDDSHTNSSEPPRAMYSVSF